MYKILVAEDEMIERKVLCRTLKQQLGDQCAIFEAKNGREALEILERDGAQIAVLDIQMPGCSGLEVARRIREQGMPCVILFLSAFDNFSYAKQAIAVRAMDYILKPYDEKELLYAVEAAMHTYDMAVEHGLFGEYSYHPEEPAPRAEEKEDLRLSSVREKIQTFIAENYARELSMQDAAQAMNYSDAYFCKLFKECFRVNFSAYLNEYRIEKAKTLLAESGMGIKDVSVACGYSDSNYFARVFKRITGTTPSEFRLAADRLPK
ncbi:MAG: response regulator [Oscillospiraceae bacterium]|nr:response regulator [Oscillospiraceae bacterium]